MPQDRRDRHDVHPALEEGGREEVPEQMEVERDPGQLLDLEDRPTEGIRLGPVRDVKDEFGFPGLPADDRGRGLIERDDPGPVAFSVDFDLIALHVPPAKPEDLRLPEACVEGKLDKPRGTASGGGSWPAWRWPGRPQGSGRPRPGSGHGPWDPPNRTSLS